MKQALISQALIEPIENGFVVTLLRHQAPGMSYAFSTMKEVYKLLKEEQGNFRTQHFIATTTTPPVKTVDTTGDEIRISPEILQEEEDDDL